MLIPEKTIKNKTSQFCTKKLNLLFFILAMIFNQILCKWFSFSLYKLITNNFAI